MGDMDALEKELDALFASPLEDFVAERDRLAKEISTSGDKDAARSVKSLRKPSIVAWTLNQLARRDPDGLAGLVETGANMREALERGDPTGAREAQAVRRSQLRQLGDAASEILRAGGHAASSTHVDKVRAVLLQATTDQDIARAISEGRLTELPAADALPDAFEGFTSAGVEGGDAAEDTRPTRRRQRLEERVEKLRTEAEAAAQEAARLARAAESVRVAAEAAEDVAAAAQRAADRAMRHLEEAEKELRDDARRS